MPYYGWDLRRVRSKEGKKLDEEYRLNKIGYTYYNKIYNKPKYWTVLN